MLGFSSQNIKLLPVNFHLKRVVFDLSGGFGLADLVCKVLLLWYFSHLCQRQRLKKAAGITTSCVPYAVHLLRQPFPLFYVIRKRAFH